MYDMRIGAYFRIAESKLYLNDDYKIDWKNNVGFEALQVRRDNGEMDWKESERYYPVRFKFVFTSDMAALFSLLQLGSRIGQ